MAWIGVSVAVPGTVALLVLAWMVYADQRSQPVEIDVDPNDLGLRFACPHARER